MAQEVELMAKGPPKLTQRARQPKKIAWGDERVNDLDEEKQLCEFYSFILFVYSLLFGLTASTPMLSSSSDREED